MLATRGLTSDFTDLTDVGYAGLNLRFYFLTSDFTDFTDFCYAGLNHGFLRIYADFFNL